MKITDTRESETILTIEMSEKDAKEMARYIVWNHNGILCGEEYSAVDNFASLVLTSDEVAEIRHEYDERNKP